MWLHHVLVFGCSWCDALSFSCGFMFDYFLAGLVGALGSNFGEIVFASWVCMYASLNDLKALVGGCTGPITRLVAAGVLDCW